MKQWILGCAVGLLFSSAAGASPWQKKEVGVLLVSEFGGGDWNRFVADARKSLGKGIPLQTHTGALSTRSLQRAVDRLQAEKVQRIIVIPVQLETAVPETAQLRYLFGAESLPSKAFLDKWRMKAQLIKRVKTKVSVVITDGFDGDDAIRRALLERALEMSREPKKEAVILVGSGAADDAEDKLLSARVESLAGNIAIRGGFSEAHGILIRPNGEKKPQQHDKSLHALRSAIREKSKKHRVIVVPYQLVDDGSARAWKKSLDNLFFLWKGKTLIPHDALYAWLKSRLDGARAAENMVRFKDDGKPLPSMSRKSRINP